MFYPHISTLLCALRVSLGLDEENIYLIQCLLSVMLTV